MSTLTITERIKNETVYACPYCGLTRCQSVCHFCNLLAKRAAA